MGDLPITSMLTTAHFNGIRASACKSGFGYDKENDGFYFEVGEQESEIICFYRNSGVLYNLKSCQYDNL